MTQNSKHKIMFFDKNPHNFFITRVDHQPFASPSFSPGAVRGATQQTVLYASDPTVIGSVLEFAGEDEEGGEGGD